jgi:LmbE family N-acetylglucosaminyl deacetylase
MDPRPSPGPLVEMPTDWARALVVVAHPDDVEYGAAAAVARWTDEGRTVTYLLVTSGEAGIDGIAPQEAGPLRQDEERASAAIVGVHEVEFLDHPDGLVEYGVPLRRDIALAIRRHRPELILTINHHAYWATGGLNMADHRNVGLATLDAVRDAANRWLFRQEGGPPPWAGARYVAVAASPLATHAVDITATLDRGVASLQAHAIYLRELGDHPAADPPSFLRGIAEATAARFGDRLATSFELIEL